MGDKKFRISKDDLEGGQEETKEVAENSRAPSVDESQKANEEKGSEPTKAKKSFRPKLKAPIPGMGKGKKGVPKTKGKTGPGDSSSAEQAQRGFIRRQHPVVLVGSGIALFAVFFAGTFFIIDALKTDRQRSEDALAYSTKAVQEVQEGINRSQKDDLPFSFLKGLAGASEDLSKKVKARKREYRTEVTGKPQLTEPTLSVIDADLLFLRSFADLADVEDSQIGKRWRRIKRSMDEAVDSMNGERPTVESEISDDPTLLPTKASLDRSLKVANQTVLAANRELQAWFAQLRRIRNQCERVQSFIASSSSLVGEYRDQRSETDSALSTPRLRWDDAYDILSDESARRDELAARFGSEQPPLLAAGSWSQMALLVRESASVLSRAAEGIATEPALFWPRSVTKPVFDSESQRISAEIGSTEIALQSELTAAEDQTCNRKKPPRPAV